MLAWTYVLMLTAFSAALAGGSSDEDKAPALEPMEDEEKPILKNLDDSDDGGDDNPKMEDNDGDGDGGDAGGGGGGGGNGGGGGGADGDESGGDGGGSEPIDNPDAEHPKGYTRGISEARRNQLADGQRRDESESGGEEAAPASGAENVKFEEGKESASNDDHEDGNEGYDGAQKYTAIIDGSAEPHAEKARGKVEPDVTFEDT